MSVLMVLLGLAIGAIVMLIANRLRSQSENAQPAQPDDSLLEATRAEIARAEGARAETARLERSRAEALLQLEETKTKAELLSKEAELQAKDIIVNARAEAERETRESRRELSLLESKFEAREESFEKRVEAFDRREADLNRRDQNLRTREKASDEKESERQALIDEARQKLETVAGLTREEARRNLIDEMVSVARHDAARQITGFEHLVKVTRY